MGHRTSSSLPPILIEPVSSQESEWSCICMLGVSTMPLSRIFILDFRIVPTVLYFFFFHFLTHKWFPSWNNKYRWNNK